MTSIFLSRHPTLTPHPLALPLPLSSSSNSSSSRSSVESSGSRSAPSGDSSSPNALSPCSARPGFICASAIMSCKNRDRDGASECTERLSRVQRSCNSSTQHIHIGHEFTMHIRHAFLCAHRHDAANGTAISRTRGGIRARRCSWFRRAKSVPRCCREQLMPLRAC